MNRSAGIFLAAICSLLSSFYAPRAVGQSSASPDFGNISKPDFFPILPWDPYHSWGLPMIERRHGDGLQSIAECNFNMAGFVLPRDLRQCRELGLGAIMLPTDPAFT